MKSQIKKTRKKSLRKMMRMIIIRRHRETEITIMQWKTIYITKSTKKMKKRNQEAKGKITAQIRGQRKEKFCVASEENVTELTARLSILRKKEL